MCFFFRGLVPTNHPSHSTILVLKPMVTPGDLSFLGTPSCFNPSCFTHPMAFPTALCASWRCAFRRSNGSLGRQRGVLLGAQLALSQRQREWAEKAMEGGAGAFKV